MSARRHPQGPALFAPGELALTSSPQVRLRELARRAPRERTGSRQDEDARMMRQLRSVGDELARRFGLSYRAIDPEREGVTAHYGICYEDGRIRIRLRHARTRGLLKQSSLIDTLCHELAHLRHLDHSLRFRRLYGRILGEARRLGYYRPGPGDAPRPRQLALFRDEDCGTRPARAGTEERKDDAGAVRAGQALHPGRSE